MIRFFRASTCVETTELVDAVICSLYTELVLSAGFKSTANAAQKNSDWESLSGTSGICTNVIPWSTYLFLYSSRALISPEVYAVIRKQLSLCNVNCGEVNVDVFFVLAVAMPDPGAIKLL